MKEKLSKTNYTNGESIAMIIMWQKSQRYFEILSDLYLFDILMETVADKCG